MGLKVTEIDLGKVVEVTKAEFEATVEELRNAISSATGSCLTEEQVKQIVQEMAGTQENDPTVPEWAKQPQKPTYTYEEITGKPNAETWTFTLEDGTAVEKRIFIASTTKLISFTIDGVSYRAVEGMTWGEWVESSYNTGGFDVDYYADHMGYCISALIYPNYVHYESNLVEAEQTINAGTAYTIEDVTNTSV